MIFFYSGKSWATEIWTERYSDPTKCATLETKLPTAGFEPRSFHPSMYEVCSNCRLIFVVNFFISFLLFQLFHPALDFFKSLTFHNVISLFSCISVLTKVVFLAGAGQLVADIICLGETNIKPLAPYPFNCKEDFRYS